jgi:hypothetical protein
MLSELIQKYYPLPFEDAKNIGISCALWTLSYLITLILPLPFKPVNAKLKKLDDLDVRNRTISFFHGLILMIFSGYEFYFAPGSCGDPNT